MSFTADHHGFYHCGSPFYPLIQEDPEVFLKGANTVSIHLPARLSDDLDWTKQIALAQTIAAEGKFLLWEIDLGLCSLQLTPEDSASFYSFSLALEQFSKKVWPVFQEQTFGTVLYRGSSDFLSIFPSSFWETESSDKQLHSTQLFSEYLHRLISFLPDLVLPFALIDLPGEISAARQAQLFSRERFESICLGLRGSKTPFAGLRWKEGVLYSTLQEAASLGICLPYDDSIDEELLKNLDALVADLNCKGIPFRIAPEEKLMEEWDGLDKLVVFSNTLSPRGKRKLLGFSAAGGEVIFS